MSLSQEMVLLLQTYDERLLVNINRQELYDELINIVTPAGTSPTRLVVNMRLEGVLRDISSGGALCTKALDFLHLLLDKVELPVSEQEALINSLVDKCVNIHQSQPISQAHSEVALKVMTILKNLFQWLDADLGRDPVTSGLIKEAVILCLDTTPMANVMLANLSLSTLFPLQFRGGAGLKDKFDKTVQIVLRYMLHTNDDLRLKSMSLLEFFGDRIRNQKILNPDIAETLCIQAANSISQLLLKWSNESPGLQVWRFLFKFFGTAIHNTQLLTLLLKIHQEEVSTQVRNGTSGGIRNHQELLKAWSSVVANFALDETYYQNNLTEIVMPLISNNITEAGTLRGKVTIWMEVLSVLENQLSRFFGTVTYPFLEHLFNASHQDIALLRSTRVLILALVLSKNSDYQNKDMGMTVSRNHPIMTEESFKEKSNKFAVYIVKVLENENYSLSSPLREVVLSFFERQISYSEFEKVFLAVAKTRLIEAVFERIVTSDLVQYHLPRTLINWVWLNVQSLDQKREEDMRIIISTLDWYPRSKKYLELSKKMLKQVMRTGLLLRDTCEPVLAGLPDDSSTALIRDMLAAATAGDLDADELDGRGPGEGGTGGGSGGNEFRGGRGGRGGGGGRSFGDRNRPRPY